MDLDGADVQEPRRSIRDGIAIVGMACLFPGAPNLDAYWQNIVSKVDAVTDPPPEAWDEDVFYDPASAENDRVYCKRGGFLGPHAYFEPLQYGVMPKGVEGAEPDQWLALKVAYAALADAGYQGDVPEGRRTAVIVGKGNYPNRGNSTVSQHGRVVDQTLDILQALHPELAEADLELIRKDLKSSLPPFNSDTAPGLIPNIVASRISNRLDLMGPSYTVDAACASFMVAMDAAVRGLRNGEFDLALVGGIQGWTPLPMLSLFCQLGALSRQEQIRPFDKSADGTILGEGVGMVVLKRVEDAEGDGNRVYAYVKGVGISSDGRGLGVLAPRLEGEVLALQKAYENGELSPETIDLIEAHGTGTPAGDATEIEALNHVFGPRADVFPPVALGSVKSMVGHLMPAAGAAGLIKAALALHHKTLPPTLHVDQPNSELDPDKGRFYINTETRPWIHGRQGIPRRAGVSAFGFGGINGHVILEEDASTDEALPARDPLQWDSEMCLFRGETRSDLMRHGERVQRLLRAAPGTALKDLAYTLNVKQENATGDMCLSIVASSVEDLQKKLDRALERLSDPECRKIKEVQGIYFAEESLTSSGQLAFLFPGEGSQYENMLLDLCLHFPEVRQHFDSIDRVFSEQGRGYVPSDLIFPRSTFSDAERTRVESGLWQMEGAVESVLTANRALLTLLSRLQISPDAVVGHSTGDYAAMLASGMLAFEDEEQVGQFASELNQIYRDAAAEDSIPRTVLIAVGADVETVLPLLEQADGRLYHAMDNCPHQTVIVGEEATVGQVTEQLRRQGVLYERLPFDRPYHTPLFEAFTERLRPFLSRWLVSGPRIKAYSCATASPFPDDPEEVRRIAAEHWRRPVEFGKTVEAMYDDGVRVFVEVGPRGNLTAFVDDILRGRPHLAVPANVRSRSGIIQLNHLVAMLAAHGVTMELDYLYDRRSPHLLDLDDPGALVDERRQASRSRMKLKTGWPTMSISEETAAHLRRRIGGAVQGADDGERSTTDAQMDGDLRTAPIGDDGVSPGSQPASSSVDSLSPPPNEAGDERRVPKPAPDGDRPASRTGAAQVMSAHLQTMEQFLDVQNDIMQTFLVKKQGVSAGLTPPETREGTTGVTHDGEVEKRTGADGGQGQPNARSPIESLAASSLARPAGGPEPDISSISRQRPSQTSMPGSARDVDAGLEPDPATSLSRDGVRETLLGIVSNRTGYPVDMLDLDLDLEADLGIDSIKRVEILGSFRRETDLLQDVDMEGLAGRKTLRQVIDFVMTHQSDGKDEVLTSSANGGAKDVQGRQAAVSSMPFVETIVSLTAGEEVVVLCELDPEVDLFLRDHTLGRQVSVTDPALVGLPVMPLTMTMEMLAEAAAVLVPDQTLIGMRDVRAYRWITFEGGSRTLRIVAKRDVSASSAEVRTYVEKADSGNGARGSTRRPIVEGTMVFGDSYPEPPKANEWALRGDRPSQWAARRLYQDGMFHGPAFQGVASIDRWGEDGAKATLVVPPHGRPIAEERAGAFLTDPVMLDQPGQVVAFWMSEYMGRLSMILPFRLDSLHLYGPPLAAGEGAASGQGEKLKCQARITVADDSQVRSDLDVICEDGQLWARFEGWEDRVFKMPETFIRFQLSPRDVTLSEPWRTLLDSWSDLEDFKVCRLRLDDFPGDFFEAHSSIWLRVLAHAVLSWRERELWRSLTTPKLRRIEWLFGRVAAKDAVRQHLEERYGLVLPPADIEILPDEHNRPVVHGTWLDDVPLPPIVSISHSEGLAVAVTGDGSEAIGVGIDVERVGRMPEGAEGLAFAPSEQSLLSSLNGGDVWPLRLWCAKEAVAKSLGQGMVGGPRKLVVEDLDVDAGTVWMRLTGELARRVPAAGGERLVAHTTEEGDLIVAAALYAPEE